MTNVHVRVVGCLWGLTGIAIGALALWGLAVPNIEPSWFIALVFSVVCLAAAFTFFRGLGAGRILTRTVSVLILLYTAAWLFAGGVDDARGYAPVLIFLAVLAAYSLVVTKREDAA